MKFILSFIAIAIVAVSVVFCGQTQNPSNDDYMRIHITANSNSQQDQDIKYLVKDAVVKYLAPFIANCDTKEKAEKMLLNSLDGIETVADKTLKSAGFNYTSKASVKNENFPTRSYQSLTLESGFYDALIIELGSGKGDNWWCVVYPPLCFTGEGVGYVYRSKILDVINDFFKKEN